MPNDTKYLGNNKQLVKVGALCIKKEVCFFNTPPPDMFRYNIEALAKSKRIHLMIRTAFYATNPA